MISEISCRCIIFDFFGTLVDYKDRSEGNLFEETVSFLNMKGFTGGTKAFLAAWDPCFVELSHSTEKELTEYSMLDIVELFLARISLEMTPEEKRRFVDMYIQGWSRGVSYASETTEMIRHLSEVYTLGVVSNTHNPPLVHGTIEKMGIYGLFTAVIDSCTFGRRKPHRSIFDHALSLLNAAPEECVFVGDSYSDDYCGARNAGIRALLIDNSGRYTNVPVEDKIRKVTDISTLLQ